jgi:putative FmdB family regulatory protein
MPRYDYGCNKCKIVFEFEKSMSAAGPDVCPACGHASVDRVFLPDASPSLLDPNRKPWTYKECLKYKFARWKDGPLVKIDPSKHGDRGAEHSPGVIVPEKKKRKR